METMASSESIIGSVLDGKYKVERLLGRGGMGEVYAGTHLRLERAVAIKILHGDLNDNASFVARFAREARTAAKLEHPNAVHVYDFGSLEDGSTYLVMEFIEGVTLREVLRANGTLNPGIAIDLIRQAAGAVGAAHARGIVHRDLKPENMMVRQDETGRLVLKVVDFGLAKILENSTSQLTNKSELMGTPKYMAPEQFQATTVDGRADVYALGCVLFELLAGRTPFEGTFIEIVGKHVYADVPMVADFGIELPEAIESVIRRALAKDPEQRLATAGDFVRELDAAFGTAAFESAGVTIPLRAADTVAPVTVPTPDESETLRAPDGIAADDDPLRTQRDPRLSTPVTGQDAGQRATVVVPTGGDATGTVGRSKVTKPSTKAVGTKLVGSDAETAAFPTRVVAAPPIARRAWIVPATLAMSAVVAVAAWQGFGRGAAEPAPANSASPVAPAFVPRETTTSAPVNNAADEEPAIEEPAAAVDAEVAPAEDPAASDSAPTPGNPRPAKPPAPPRTSVAVEAPEPVPEVQEMRPTPEQPGEGLTPAERRRLRKIADRIERERRRREAMRQNPDYRQP
jgi:serine/threonine-protein kinase